MKTLLEYLERALQLEELAKAEINPQFKSQLLDQADAYRKLAAKHAEDSALPPPIPRRDNL